MKVAIAVAATREEMREDLADILMSDSVMNADGCGRNYALVEADAVLKAGYSRGYEATVTAWSVMRNLDKILNLSDPVDARRAMLAYRNQVISIGDR